MILSNTYRLRSRKFLRFSSSVILDLEPPSSYFILDSSSDISISIDMELLVLDFLLAGALEGGSSAFLRPFTAGGFFLPRPRVLGRACSLSSDIILPSLIPRAEQIEPPLTLDICGEVFMF